MRVGTDVPYMIEPEKIAATIASLAQGADDAGLASLWVADHLFDNPNVGRRIEWPMLEGYTVLGFIAARTSRIRIGTMVTAAVYRPPGLLGKMITSLDVLSDGRMYVGLGAAWHEQEAVGLGLPFPPLGERFERLEEVVRILLQMWEGDDRPFAGKHYQLAWPLNSPNSVQRPHPPLLIAGGGEKKTLRLVAQYADACNFIHYAPLGRDTDWVRRKLDVLREHCSRLGRPYEEIEKTAWTQIDLSARPTGAERTPQQALEELAQLADLGIDHVIVDVPGIELPGKMDLLGELAHLAAPLIPRGRSEPRR